MPFDIYVFASTSLKNIRTGVESKLWAVQRPSMPSMCSQYRTKAKKMPVGAHGVFYCNKSLTVPFIVASSPDPQQVVKDVWDGEFMLPFRIHPLGTTAKSIEKDEIDQVLPSFRDSDDHWYDVMRYRLQLVFLPSQLTIDDWQVLVQKLAPLSAL